MAILQGLHLRDTLGLPPVTAIASFLSLPLQRGGYDLVGHSATIAFYECVRVSIEWA